MAWGEDKGGGRKRGEGGRRDGSRERGKRREEPGVKLTEKRQKKEGGGVNVWCVRGCCVVEGVWVGVLGGVVGGWWWGSFGFCGGVGKRAILRARASQGFKTRRSEYRNGGADFREFNEN